MMKNKDKGSSGFKQGETVTVSVDFVSGEIQWKVDENIRLVMVVADLRDRGVIWVPYLMM